jgi:hypothetical protein
MFIHVREQLHTIEDIRMCKKKKCFHFVIYVDNKHEIYLTTNTRYIILNINHYLHSNII